MENPIHLKSWSRSKKSIQKKLEEDDSRSIKIKKSRLQPTSVRLLQENPSQDEQTSNEPNSNPKPNEAENPKNDEQANENDTEAPKPNENKPENTQGNDSDTDKPKEAEAVNVYEENEDQHHITLKIDKIKFLTILCIVLGGLCGLLLLICVLCLCCRKPAVKEVYQHPQFSRSGFNETRDLRHNVPNNALHYEQTTGKPLSNTVNVISNRPNRAGQGQTEKNVRNSRQMRQHSENAGLLNKNGSQGQVAKQKDLKSKADQGNFDSIDREFDQMAVQMEKKMLRKEIF